MRLTPPGRWEIECESEGERDRGALQEKRKMDARRWREGKWVYLFYTGKTTDIEIEMNYLLGWFGFAIAAATIMK